MKSYLIIIVWMRKMPALLDANSKNGSTPAYVVCMASGNEELFNYNEDAAYL